MSRSTVDLTNLLKELSHRMQKIDATESEVRMARIEIHADGSYCLFDGADKLVLDSDKIQLDDLACDVHGLLYCDLAQIESRSDDQRDSQEG